MNIVLFNRSRKQPFVVFIAVYVTSGIKTHFCEKEINSKTTKKI